jgi:hypothetical protein
MDPINNRSAPGRTEKIFHPIEVRLTLRPCQPTPTHAWELVARCNHEPLDQQQGRLDAAIANLTLGALKDCYDVTHSLAELCVVLMKLQEAIPASELPQVELLRAELVLGVRAKA